MRALHTAYQKRTNNCNSVLATFEETLKNDVTQVGGGGFGPNSNDVIYECSLNKSQYTIMSRT